MKKLFKGFCVTGLIALLVIGFSGCGSTKTNSSVSTGAQGKGTVSNTTDQSTANTTTTVNSKVDNNSQNIYMVIEPGTKLGPDGKYHDAYINGNIKITRGQKTTLNIYNYDQMPHTYTSPDLNLNIKVKASTKKGQPALTQYTFTPDKEGTFNWFCADPCDDDNGDWAMTHSGYMKGTITVLPSTNKTQYVSLVIMPGGKLGTDGKRHDAYTPGNITLKANEPVQLSVYNLDGMPHTYTANDLGLNMKVKASPKKGQPSLTTYTFTPDKKGTFKWFCADPCDDDNGGWAMTHNGYMKGIITVN